MEQLRSSGQHQLFQQAADSVNYTKIVEYYAGKDGFESPSPIRKILGQETRFDRYLSGANTTLIKTPTTRKNDLWLPKNVQAAIDLHVKEVANSKITSLAELIFKLVEICDNEIFMAR